MSHHLLFTQRTWQHLESKNLLWLLFWAYQLRKCANFFEWNKLHSNSLHKSHHIYANERFLFMRICCNLFSSTPAIFLQTCRVFLKIFFDILLCIQEKKRIVHGPDQLSLSDINQLSKPRTSDQLAVIPRSFITTLGCPGGGDALYRV